MRDSLNELILADKRARIDDISGGYGISLEAAHKLVHNNFWLPETFHYTVEQTA